MVVTASYSKLSTVGTAPIEQCDSIKHVYVLNRLFRIQTTQNVNNSKILSATRYVLLQVVLSQIC